MPLIGPTDVSHQNLRLGNQELRHDPRRPVRASPIASDRGTRGTRKCNP